MDRIVQLTLSVGLILVLASCGKGSPGAEKLDEAYRVGYDMGIADECGREGERREPMPSAYDDSLGEGELASAFQAGYSAARSEAQPCSYVR
jgi:hypothetical protein